MGLNEDIQNGNTVSQLKDLGYSDSDLINYQGHTGITWTDDYINQQLGYDIHGENGFDYFGSSVSLSSDGTMIAVGAPGNDHYGNEYSNTFNSGDVRVYQYANNSWTQLEWDTLDGQGKHDESGHSVSLSSDGTIVAIGAHKNDGYNANGVQLLDSGHVRVFQYANSTWTQLGQDIDGEAAGDESGRSVSLSSDGTIVAIGAPKNDANGYTDAGHVRIYQWNGTDTWTQMGSDIESPSPDAAEEFGYTVTLSGDGTIFAIGVPKSSTGYVKLYQWNGTDTWTQMGSDIDGEGNGDQLGYSLSLSNDGTIVAIGAPQKYAAEGKGHVSIYQWNGTDTWTQMGSDIDGKAAGDQFGYSVSLSDDGTIVASGAPESMTGYVKLYQWNGTDTWTEIIEIEQTPGANGAAKSGYSVNLSSDGTIVAIGSPYMDVYHWQEGWRSDVGDVRVFNLATSSEVFQPFTLAELKTGGVTVQELHFTGGYTVTELHEAGFTLSEFKTGGFTADELENLFTVQEFHDAGFTATEMKGAEHTAGDLKDIYELSEIRLGGYTATDFKNDANLDIQDSHDAGFTATEMKGAEHTAGQLTEIYNIQEMHDGGYRVDDMIEAGHEVDDLKNIYEMDEIFEGGFTNASDLFRNGHGFSINQLKTIKQARPLNGKINNAADIENLSSNDFIYIYSRDGVLRAKIPITSISTGTEGGNAGKKTINLD